MALPGTLIGLILAVLYYQPSLRRGHWRLRDGCIECIPSRTIIGGKSVGAQTWGHIIFYRDERMMEWADLNVHERVHVVQSMVLTWPVFAALYSLHFLAAFAVNIRGGWHAAYRRIWAERHAYDVQRRFSAGKLPSAWGKR